MSLNKNRFHTDKEEFFVCSSILNSLNLFQVLKYKNKIHILYFRSVKLNLKLICHNASRLTVNRHRCKYDTTSIKSKYRKLTSLNEMSKTIFNMSYRILPFYIVYLSTYYTNDHSNVQTGGNVYMYSVKVYRIRMLKGKIELKWKSINKYRRHIGEKIVKKTLHKFLEFLHFYFCFSVYLQLHILYKIDFV